jgi:hypothetical protein
LVGKKSFRLANRLADRACWLFARFPGVCPGQGRRSAQHPVFSVRRPSLGSHGLRRAPVFEDAHNASLGQGRGTFQQHVRYHVDLRRQSGTLLTGLYEQTHQYTFGTPPIVGKFIQESYPAVLRRAGYRTGFIGKFGVNVAQGDRESMFDSFHPIGRNPYLKKQPDGSLRHESELAGDRAIEFINQQKGDAPFCLSISFNAAHTEDGDKRPGIVHFPWPKAVDGMYEDVEINAPRLSDPNIFQSHRSS